MPIARANRGSVRSKAHYTGISEITSCRIVYVVFWAPSIAVKHRVTESSSLKLLAGRQRKHGPCAGWPQRPGSTQAMGAPLYAPVGQELQEAWMPFRTVDGVNPA